MRMRWLARWTNQWHHSDSRKDDPGESPLGGLGKREGESSHQWNHQDRVEYRKEDVLAVAAGDQWSPLGWAHPLGDEKDPDDRQGQWPDHDDTKT
jgi:hypothetical protein